MIGAVMRSTKLRTCHVALAPRALAARSFAAVGQKPKLEDSTLEGRYATALFMASSDRLETIYADLVNLRTMMNESVDFKLMIETPGISPEMKVAALNDVCDAAATDVAVVNFLKVLVENKRSHLLSKMIDMFEAFYRAEMGLVLCQVASATPLGYEQKSQVQKAMEKRAAAGSELIMEFTVNPSLMGGLVVKMGEAVIDQSVTAKLERLQAQLLAPVE
eukprot:TRINITY_DN57123_c0_g1_i1.p1 TRINITY_DN57123_c0_g1~~TRINITY_DN57123_c0_g1_i1.p1  ORF type:complete len:219 (+),score=51.46 TRINITY_DN57123_c0_g1_i1:46-702(+)